MIEPANRCDTISIGRTRHTAASATLSTSSSSPFIDSTTGTWPDPARGSTTWGYSWDDCSDCRGGTSAASQYRLRVVNNELITRSIERTAGTNDVYRVQFSIRYMFLTVTDARLQAAGGTLQGRRARTGLLARSLSGPGLIH